MLFPAVTLSATLDLQKSKSKVHCHMKTFVVNHIPMFVMLKFLWLLAFLLHLCFLTAWALIRLSFVSSDTRRQERFQLRKYFSLITLSLSLSLYDWMEIMKRVLETVLSFLEMKLRFSLEDIFFLLDHFQKLQCLELATKTDSVWKEVWLNGLYLNTLAVVWRHLPAHLHTTQFLSRFCPNLHHGIQILYFTKLAPHSFLKP